MGKKVGETVGSEVGMVDGALLGANVGSIVGDAVGKKVGLWVTEQLVCADGGAPQLMVYTSSSPQLFKLVSVPHSPFATHISVHPMLQESQLSNVWPLFAGHCVPSRGVSVRDSLPDPDPDPVESSSIPGSV